MILQALTAFYERGVKDGLADLELEGYKRAAIPFVVVLAKNGALTGIDDTRTQEGKRKLPRTFMVPKVFAGSRSSNIQANLLWDKASYVFGINPKIRPERVANQKQAFVSLIRTYFPDSGVDEGVAAVLKFLDSGCSGLDQYACWPEIIASDPNIAFRLAGEPGLICNREPVREVILGRASLDAGEDGICLVTGVRDLIARLENPISALKGSGKAESHLVAFNDQAYFSYGKKFNANAPIGKRASSAYVAAINYLKRPEARHSLMVGDATTIFWAEKSHEMEEMFVDLLGWQPGDEADQNNETIRALFAAPKTGTSPLTDDLTRFYVLGLAPNASRIAVRFWYQGTVGEVAKGIKQHFDDCAIVHGLKQREHLSLFQLLVSTAVQGEAKNIPSNLAGAMMMSILSGKPYPQMLLASALRRARAERDVTYQRVALIKAVLVRKARYYKENEKEVGMSLDVNNPNLGYRLGRLFAVLERAQEKASPGLNATIRDRFYGAASSTPVVVFPHLLKLKNHHISKLENKGAAVNLEKQIGEIIDGFGNDFPAHLSLPDQARFAIGYYQQRQAFFSKAAPADLADNLEEELV